MRIASVSFMYHPFYGGAEIQAQLLARTFQSWRHNVTVLTMHFGSTADREILDGVPIVRVPRRPVRPGKFTGIFRAMIQAFLELQRLEHVDVVYIQSAPFLLIPVLAFKKLYGVPVVMKMISGGVTAKSTILMTSRWSWLNWFKRKLLNYVDAFVCLNEELADEVKGLVPGAACIHIPNGVDCSYWDRPDNPQKYKAAAALEEYKTAIYVGRLVQEKGIEVLLQVWKGVLQHEPKAKLFIVGDGPLGDEMRNLATQLGIADSVSFVGAKEDTREFLFAMDVFLLFSPNEGMSNALLEAMAAGVPIVCTENPGNSALIHHMVNGIKIKPGQIADAVSGVCRIFDDPVFAAALADRAREDVRKKFDVCITARRYEQLFSQLASGKG